VAWDGGLGDVLAGFEGAVSGWDGGVGGGEFGVVGGWGWEVGEGVVEGWVGLCCV